MTANLPELDKAIEASLNKAGVSYSKQKIGSYTVFYGLSRHVTPEELGLHDLGPGSD